MSKHCSEAMFEKLILAENFVGLKTPIFRVSEISMETREDKINLCLCTAH